MTAPQGQLPEGAIGVDGLRGLQSMTEESVRSSIRSPFDSMISDLQSKMQNGLVGGIVKLVQGIVPAGFEAHQEFADHQLELNDRVDLLTGVRGYAQAYMSRNLDSRLGLDNYRDMAFDAPYGPTLGAHLYNGGIVFEEAGLWTVSGLATARPTAYSAEWGSSDGVAVMVQIRDSVWNVVSQFIVDQFCGGARTGVVWSLPVVIAQAGMAVTVRSWTSRWRWWDGGTQYSRLAVVKHDNRPVNPGQATVPDETT